MAGRWTRRAIEKERDTMRFDTWVTKGGWLAGSLVLGVAMLSPATLTGAAARPAAAPVWVTTTGKVVHLTLIAGWNNANVGFNFDGAAHGQMVVTVPLGAKVVGTFTNKVATPHNVDIIPYTLPLPGQGVAPAFAGAVTPLPQFRPGAPAPAPQPVSFVATTAGTYMIICGVPGHALAGMWDTFVVSPTAKVASITFK